MADPSGMEPEFMTCDWFHWFVRWDIPSDKLARDPEWDARLTREADDLFAEVEEVRKDPKFEKLPEAEGRRLALLAIRKYNQQEAAKRAAKSAIRVAPTYDPTQARVNAANEMEENLILSGKGWWTRRFYTFILPGGANPNAFNLDNVVTIVAAVRAAKLGASRVGEIGQRYKRDVKGVPDLAPSTKPPLWTATKDKTGVENAYGHFKKHGAEFPEYPNATQYAQGARSFVNNPPAGTLTKVRPNGDKLFYDPATNTFAVQRADGALRTMFRPADGINYWNLQ